MPISELDPEDIRRWMLTALDHTILITDENLNIQGDPVVDWTSLDVTLRRNEPSSGMFTVPGYSWIRDQLVDGCRVVVTRNGEYLISGPLESLLYERSDNGENAGDGVITVRFADDLANVVARLTHADPALDADSQTADNWTFTGNAELALRAAVNLNAGPGALIARRIPQLVLGAVNGVGSTITLKSERFEPLGDVLRRGATDGGGLQFRTAQVGNQIEFQVVNPPDRSGEVRWSFGLGNLRYIGYERTAPTATTAYVGGQGEGANRFVTERTDAGAEATWGRLEVMVPRPGNSALAELQADGDRALQEAAATARLQVSSMDTPDQRYGVSYGLGDLVAIEPWSGTQITDVVQTVHIQVWPTAGEVVATTIGSQAASTDSAYSRMLREIAARVGRIERLITPASMTS